MDNTTTQTTRLEVQLKESATRLIQQAEQMEISTQEAAQEASAFFIRCASMLKRIKEYWKDTRENAHKTWKGICDKEAAMSKIPAEARKIIENKLRDYRDEQRRIAEKEQRKAEEARQREEDKRKAAEMKKAERAMDKGDLEKAEEHMHAAEDTFVPPSYIQPNIDKTARTADGALTGVKDLSIEVVSLREVAQGIVDGKLPDHIIEVRLGAVKTWAKGNGIKSLRAHGLLIQEFERFSARAAKTAE